MAATSVVRQCPFATFDAWFTAAKEKEPIWPQAMNVATISCETGRPSSRMVLLQLWAPEDRCFRFYTNFNSSKGRDIAANPNVALHFYWRTMSRQVRIEGTARRASHAISDRYFDSRPRGHKISAWASSQSCPMDLEVEVDSTAEAVDQVVDAEMQKRVQQAESQFSGLENVPRPEWCGVFEVVPSYFEYWEEGAERRHRRTVFTMETQVSTDGDAQLQSSGVGSWRIQHLFP